MHHRKCFYFTRECRDTIPAKLYNFVSPLFNICSCFHMRKNKVARILWTDDVHQASMHTSYTEGRIDTSGASWWRGVADWWHSFRDMSRCDVVVVLSDQLVARAHSPRTTAAVKVGNVLQSLVSDTNNCRWKRPIHPNFPLRVTLPSIKMSTSTDFRS